MNLRLCVQALLLFWLSLTTVCGASPPACSVRTVYCTPPAVEDIFTPTPVLNLVTSAWPVDSKILRLVKRRQAFQSLRDPEKQSWQKKTAQSLREVPLMLPPDGKGLEEGTMRYLVQPRASRTGPGPWQGGRRKFRRQRPRLSHKGPMPF